MAPGNVLTPQALQTLQVATQGALGQARVLTMSDFMCRYFTSMDCRFLLQGEPLEPIEVFSSSALLPIIAWASQDAGQRLLSADFGCELKKARQGEIAVTGALCVVPHVTGHIADVTRALFFAYSATEILGLRPGALVEVYPLYASCSTLFDDHFAQLAKDDSQEKNSWPQMSQAH